MKKNINLEAKKAAAANVLAKGVQILKNILGINGLGARITRAFRGNNPKEIQASILKALDDDIEALKEAGDTETLKTRMAQRTGLAKVFTLGEFTVVNAFGIAKEGIKAIDSDLERIFEKSNNAIIGFLRLGYEGIKTGGKVAANIILWLFKKAIRLAAWLLSLIANVIKKTVNKVRAKKLGDSLVGNFEDDVDDDIDDFDFEDDTEAEGGYYIDDEGNVHVVNPDGSETIYSREEVEAAAGTIVF